MSLSQIYLNKKGVSLEKYLSENKDSIKGKRILYVLKPNMETNIIKIGIAGEYAGIDENASHDRLKSYLTSYGREKDCKTREQKQKCKYGVLLYALYGTKYNKNVEGKKTAVHQKELYLKRELRESIERVGRGTERTDINLNTILKLVADNHFIKDNPTDVKKNNEKLRVRKEKKNYKE